MKSNPWTCGNVFEVALPDGSLCYGVVIDFPLVSFSPLFFNSRPKISPSLFKKSAFKIWLMKYALTKVWPIVGSINLSKELSSKPVFYKYDSISKRFFHSISGEDDPEVSLAQCRNLECAAAWDPIHIISRLADLKVDAPNKFVESMKAENRIK